MPMLNISNRKPILTIFYQFNPWSSSIGGIQTIIKTFIKYSTDDFTLRLVGIGDKKQTIGVWQQAEFKGKLLEFMPLFCLENDNVRQPIPTSVRYTLSLLNRNLASDFMHFHRLEPSLATVGWKGDKTLFIHNDLRQQISAASSKKTILWQKFPTVYYALERSLLGQFDQIFSCNTESARFYQQSYPKIADRVSYLNNTVDNEVFFPLPLEKWNTERKKLAQRLNLADDTRFVLFSGRLHPQKNPLLLIQAIAALQVPNTHLLIAGDGELRMAIETEIAKLNLKDRISLLGSISQAELSQLQQTCSVLVLTSLYEGLPLVVLESLACGVPVVTTDCGETPNLLIEGSGLVCKERTPNAIAAAIAQILIHPEDFPPTACALAAHPYAAKAVVEKIFEQMLDRWKLSQAI